MLHTKDDPVKRFNLLPWIEKYRPMRITAILLESNVRDEIMRMVEEKDTPNLIITGRPGIGKTTTIKCLARTLYGEYYDQSVLELNASDDRGIKIEIDIARFCRSLSYIPDKNKHKHPSHKLIILDEADNITEKAQHIISKLMGLYQDTTKFAFTCNTSYNIIEIIQSRCKIIRYQKVNVDKITLRLEDVCELEKVPFEQDGLEYVAELCDGDMRCALNILELTFRRHKHVTKDAISDVYDKPQRQVLRNIIDACLKKNIKQSLKLTKLLKNKGYTGTDIASGLFSTLKSKHCSDIDEYVKLQLCEPVCETTYIISNGLDTDLQLFNCIMKLCSLNIQTDVKN